MQKREAAGNPENLDKSDEAEYNLKIEAHSKCTAEDIVEAVEANYFGTLDDAKDGVEDLSRKFKVKKVEEKQVIRKIEGEFRNLPIFRIMMAETEVGRNVIESWNDKWKFDDCAFKNSDSGKIKILVKEVEKLR